MASYEELIYDPIGHLFDGTYQAGAYGGHTDHVHIALAKHPRELLGLLLWAQRHGLHVGENPYFDTVDPVHTEGSFHYQSFGRKFGGKTLGKAADVSGSPEQMARFFRVAERALTGGPAPRAGAGGGGGGRSGGRRSSAGQAAALLAALGPINITPPNLSFRSPADVLADLRPVRTPSVQSPMSTESTSPYADALEALRQRLLGA